MKKKKKIGKMKIEQEKKKMMTKKMSYHTVVIVPNGAPFNGSL